MRESTLIARDQTVAQGLIDALYPYSVQMRGDKWHVFDARTGGYAGTGHTRYADAERQAWQFKNNDGAGYA